MNILGFQIITIISYYLPVELKENLSLNFLSVNPYYALPPFFAVHFDFIIIFYLKFLNFITRILIVRRFNHFCPVILFEQMKNFLKLYYYLFLFQYS